MCSASFLTGRVPHYDPAYGEPAVAARSGVVLRVDRAGLDPSLADLVDRMMLAAPAARPTIAEVHAALMGIRVADVAPAPESGPAPSGALRGKLVSAPSVPSTSVAPGVPVAAPSSGLKGKLLGRAPREGGP